MCNGVEYHKKYVFKITNLIRYTYPKRSQEGNLKYYSECPTLKADTASLEQHKM